MSEKLTSEDLDKRVELDRQLKILDNSIMNRIQYIINTIYRTLEVDADWDDECINFSLDDLHLYYSESYRSIEEMMENPDVSLVFNPTEFVFYHALEADRSLVYYIRDGKPVMRTLDTPINLLNAFPRRWIVEDFEPELIDLGKKDQIYQDTLQWEHSAKRVEQANKVEQIVSKLTKEELELLKKSFLGKI